MADRVDVCIVGSGAGGGALALDLSRAGLRVVVLEKGPHHTNADFTHDEISITRRNFFVPFLSDDPHVVRSSPDERGEESPFGWISCCVGGGTVHWAGYAFRLAPDDFRRATLTGGVEGAALADWPITYDELEPWYVKAEREIGVSGAGGASPFEPRRSAPYPMPPLPAHPIAKHLDVALRAAGANPYPTPKAIASQPYEGRPPCIQCPFCGSYGCEVGAKGSTLAAMLPRAVETGRCEIRARAMAREIRLDAQGRAKSVVYVDEKGLEHEQEARVVVVACGAVESPRLLLNSRSKAFPEGLANSSGLVGRHLMMQAQAGARADFLFERAEKIEGLDGREVFVGRAVRDRYADAGTLVFEFAAPSPILVAEKLSNGPGGRTLWGKELKDRLRSYYREGKHVDVEGFAECLPVAANAVDLSPDVKDRWGLASARITFSHHERDAAASERLAKAAHELLSAAKPDRLANPRWGGTYDVLQGGTCRFGSDPSRSVLDRDCRTHDVANLYVVDGSFMPTIGAVPPTLTILANAHRVADAITRRAARGEFPG